MSKGTVRAFEVQLERKKDGKRRKLRFTVEKTNESAPTDPAKAATIPELPGCIAASSIVYRDEWQFREYGENQIQVDFGHFSTAPRVCSFRVIIEGLSIREISEDELCSLAKRAREQAFPSGIGESLEVARNRKKAFVQKKTKDLPFEERVALKETVFEEFSREGIRLTPEQILDEVENRLLEDHDTRPEWLRDCERLASEQFPRLAAAKTPEERKKAFYLDRLEAWGVEPPKDVCRELGTDATKARRKFRRRQSDPTKGRKVSRSESVKLRSIVLSEWIQNSTMIVEELAAKIGKSEEATRHLLRGLEVRRTVPHHRPEK